MTKTMKAALCAAALTCAGHAQAAIITYSASCPGFCSFDKIRGGTINSVRLQGSLEGFQSFRALGAPGVPATYRVSGVANISGGNDVLFDSIQTVGPGSEVTFLFNVAYDQLLTTGLSYFQGNGTFEAGGFLEPTYTYISGATIGAQTGGRLYATPITITIDFTPTIPEPATWALMLAGFGLTGYALRRRRSQVAFA